MTPTQFLFLTQQRSFLSSPQRAFSSQQEQKPEGEQEIIIE
jgi:hypothetical protein